MVNLESLTPDGRDQQMGKQGTQTSEASFTSSEPHPGLAYPASSRVSAEDRWQGKGGWIPRPKVKETHRHRGDEWSGLRLQKSCSGH